MKMGLAREVVGTNATSCQLCQLIAFELGPCMPRACVVLIEVEVCAAKCQGRGESSRGCGSRYREPPLRLARNIGMDPCSFHFLFQSFIIS